MTSLTLTTGGGRYVPQVIARAELDNGMTVVLHAGPSPHYRLLRRGRYVRLPVDRKLPFHSPPVRQFKSFDVALAECVKQGASAITSTELV
jgi:hypothetical protein